MFRNILFIICIHMSFCYIFIDNYNWNFAHLGNRSKKKDDNDKVVFNVAEFLKKTNQHKEKRNFEYEDLKENYANDNYLEDDNELDIQDNFDLGNPTVNLVNTDLTNSNALTNNLESVDETLGDQQDKVPMVNPEDKCMFKNMKLPFFSHNRPVINRQKRKRSCFNCGRRMFDVKPVLLRSRGKRSYKDICCKCRKEIMKQFHIKDKPEMIHNSRQFYQNFTANPRFKTSKQIIEGIKISVSPKTSRKPLKKPTEHKLKQASNDYYSNAEFNERQKRFDNDDKERRLKELEDTERKVDNVEIHVYKPPSPTTDVTYYK